MGAGTETLIGSKYSALFYYLLKQVFNSYLDFKKIIFNLANIMNMCM